MERDRKGGIVGIIITIIILIMLVIFSNVNSEKITSIENVASTIVMPIENGLTYLKNKINNNDKFFQNVNELKTENESLKQKNSELEQQLREYEIMKNENDQLKQQLNLAEKYGEYKTVPGTIISRDISNYSKTLVINIGSDNGIKEKMTVFGMNPPACEVAYQWEMFGDSASATSCIASTTRDTMICKGTIENKSVLSASNIDTNARIIQGDSVETSGLGGIYLKGIHVGKIKKVNEGSNKTDSYATIETAVDFEKLENVLVITNQ